MTSRLLDAQSGRQFLSATLGQTYYFETPRVTLPGEVPPSGKRSDFVASSRSPPSRTGARTSACSGTRRTQRSERARSNLQYKPAPDR